MIDHETFACFSVESGHRGVRVPERMFWKIFSLRITAETGDWTQHLVVKSDKWCPFDAVSATQMAGARPDRS